MYIVVHQKLSARILTTVATVSVAIALLFCGTLATGQTPSPTPSSSAGDWKQVEAAMGCQGQMQPGDVIRFVIP